MFFPDRFSFSLDANEETIDFPFFSFSIVNCNRSKDTRAKTRRSVKRCCKESALVDAGPRRTAPSRSIFSRGTVERCFSASENGNELSSNPESQYMYEPNLFPLFLDRSTYIPSETEPCSSDQFYSTDFLTETIGN